MKAPSGAEVATVSAEGADPVAAGLVDGKRLEIARALADAAALPGMDTEAIAWLQQKINERAFNLVVAGQFKRGKSSLINALLGEPLLPVGVIPLTSVVTVLRAGAKVRARVELLDGSSRELVLAELADYVTERGNPHNAKGVRQVTIEHPSAWLSNGVQLIDTPGIGSVYEHNTDITREYLPQADAVLLIASVEQPLSRAELDFLASIREYASRIFCLLNKTDHLRREELDESVRFAEETIRAALNADVPIFPVSARLALEGKLDRAAQGSESGFVDFENALRHFMAEEGWNVWLGSIARSLLRILGHRRFALGLEFKVLSTPLQQIESNLAAFHAKKRELERALIDYQVLMEAGSRALIREDIEPELERFKRAEQARIGALVRSWHEQCPTLSARKLDAELERHTVSEIRNAFDAWLASEDRKASEAFDKLCGRFWGEMQASVDQLVRYSGELFGVKFEPVTADSRWSPESGFYYKFWYEPTGLATLSSSLVTLLPKFLSRKLVLRRRKTVALELIDMQAGRLRHDFEQRVLQSAQDARRRMVRRIESTLAGIDTAIANGVAAHRRGTADVVSALAQLSRLDQTMVSIEARVRNLDSAAGE
jgi:GTP-binding protein EngB required for normal cell division